MAKFWIVSSERIAYTKYLVEAETEAEAKERSNEEYLGYADGRCSIGTS